MGKMIDNYSHLGNRGDPAETAGWCIGASPGVD